jgi:hypothetical protein
VEKQSQRETQVNTGRIGEEMLEVHCKLIF